MTVKFRMLFTVKDWRYALYQIISIGRIALVVFYPALYSIADKSYAPIVYSYTAVLLFLALCIWWNIINTKEVKRSVFEEFEMEMEEQRVRIGEPKKDKEEDINRYRNEASKKLERLKGQ